MDMLGGEVRDIVEQAENDKAKAKMEYRWKH